MDDLLDFCKKLLLIYAIVIIIAALPFVLMRMVEVCESEEGLWQSYPHSGFIPDSPREAPNSNNGK